MIVESTSSAPTVSSTVAKATELHEAFTDFVGQTFFAQMMKAMRSTQGKPAYFHGGQAEEVFQTQFDQTLVEAMSRATADRFAEPIFEHQFPHYAATLRAADALSGAK
jgi:hypothetical protein